MKGVQMKQKQPLYTDQEIATFMMTETMNAYERGRLDALKQLQSTLVIMEARNPKISFKICMNVIEDSIKTMEEGQ